MREADSYSRQGHHGNAASQDKIQWEDSGYSEVRLTGLVKLLEVGVGRGKSSPIVRMNNNSDKINIIKANIY